MKKNTGVLFYLQHRQCGGAASLHTGYISSMQKRKNIMIASYTVYSTAHIRGMRSSSSIGDRMARLYSVKKQHSDGRPACAATRAMHRMQNT